MKKNEDTFRGIVRNLKWRKEEPYTIVTFRLEQRDEEDKIYNYIPVKIKELQVNVYATDEAEVEVIGKVNKEGMLIPKSIRILWDE